MLTLVHEFAVVKGLSIDIVIGAELLRPSASRISYMRTGRDTFQLGKSSCERSDANREQLRSSDDPQLQFNAPLATATGQRCDNSMLLSAQLSPQQTARRERLQRLLNELNINSVVAPDAVKQDVIAIVSRRVDEFALDDDIGHTRLVEHLIDREQHSFQTEIWTNS